MLSLRLRSFFWDGVYMATSISNGFFICGLINIFDYSDKKIRKNDY